jgi:hypothetical protein
MTEFTTISPGYLEQQRTLHSDQDYGIASLSFAPVVAELIRQTGCTSVSDYGAGKKRLLEGLAKAGVIPQCYYPYDPVFPEYGLPRQADLVCCIDVLEHIEPDLLENVLSQLSEIVTKLGFFSIHMGPAARSLPDGRNAHLIQQPSSWWLGRLIPYFEISHLQSHRVLGEGMFLIVRPKKRGL